MEPKNILDLKNRIKEFISLQLFRSVDIIKVPKYLMNKLKIHKPK